MFFPIVTFFRYCADAAPLGLSGKCRRVQGALPRLARLWACAGFMLLAWGGTAHGATCTAVAGTNNWGTAATWTGCGGGPPADGDSIVIPSGATVVLNVDTNRVNDLAINAGGVLRGDNTNKTLNLNKGAGTDVTNDGTIDFGQGNLAAVFTRLPSQWAGSGTWNLSTVDLNNRALTFAAGSTMTISMSGAATPFTGFGSITSLVGMTWNFAGSVAQTLPTSANAIFGNVTASNTAGVTLGMAFTATNLLGNLTVAANGVLNNGAFPITLASAKSFSVAAGGRFNLTGTSTMVTVSGGGTKTFNATSTVDYAGADQAATAETYGNLIMSGSGIKTLAAGTTTVAGNYTLSAGVTYAGTTNNPVVNLGGNFSNSGTFNSGTGIFTFNGSAAQTLTGATTFSRLTMANTAAAANQKLTISNDVTVSTQLTFTTGRIVTGANEVIIPSGSTVSGAGSGTGWVAGRLQKFAAAGSPTVTFEVGSDGASAPALAYAPASLSFTGVAAGGGSLIATASTGDHAQIATSGLDSAKSVNRWWSLTTTGVTGTALPAFTNFSSTFTFVVGDVDGGANTANFETERWSGAAWNTTTVGTRTGTTTQATGITALGEFAVAEKKVVVVTPASFNVVEPGASATTGKIFTKIGGLNFSLDIVALDAANAVLTGFTGAVAVDVVDNTSGGACSGLPLITAFTNQTFVVGDAGRHPLSSPNAVVNVYRNAKVRIKYPTSSPTVTTCSTDNFAIRPASITISATDNDPLTAGIPRVLNNTGATGGFVHNAGRPFTLSAQAFLADGATTATNYDGTPTLVTGSPSCVAPPASCATGTLTLVVGAWSGAGTRRSDTASYTEAGVFTLQLEDQTYANVDNPVGDTPLVNRTVPSTGTITVGRFIPDHFTLSASAITNRVALSCASTFTYMGEGIGLTLTLEAHQFPIGITTNYKGTLGKLDPNAPASFSFGAKNGATNLTTRVSALTTVGSWSSGSAAITGTLTILRAAPLTADDPLTVGGPYTAVQFGIAPVDADLVAMGTLDQDVDGVGGNDHKTVGATTEVRFGQLRLKNALGSERLALVVPMQIEYWNGTGFLVSNNDSCTTLSQNNIVMSNYTQNLAPATPCKTAFPGAAITFASGKANPTLAAPGSGKNGSVDLRVRLSASSAAGNYCASVGAGTQTAASAAPLSYLLGRWNSSDDDGNANTAYDDDPMARANFGIYNNPSKQFIYQRENY